MPRRVRIKTQLERLRNQCKASGVTKEIREKAMNIYRRRPEYITKEDLLLFGIIIPKTNS